MPKKSDKKITFKLEKIKRKNFITMSKIAQKIGKIVEDLREKVETDLLEGNLEGAENKSWDCMLELHGLLMSESLNKVGQSKAFKEKLAESYASEGVSDLRLRNYQLQLKNGEWIEIKSYYARQIGKDFGLDSRHLSKHYWSILKNISLSHASVLSAFGVMSCSFEIGKELLQLVGIKTNANRIRKVATSYGKLTEDQGVKALLKKGESLAGKRVVIGIDGGRSRMRETKESRSKKGYTEYDTPWREPKIIVIQEINKAGEMEKKLSLPLYLGTLKSTKQTMAKLKSAMKTLQIDQAEIIQFIADGAPAIWSRIKPLFRQLKIPFSKVVLTLDYYHAVEHLKELSKLLPCSQEEQQKAFNKWKADLWEGLARGIVRNFKKRIKQSKTTLNQEMKTALNYFYKHHDRMQYKSFKRRKLLCGSGLVESAVRRIINLRFKGSSTFWLKENLEKLIVLRCVFLAKRWTILLNNNKLALKKIDTV